MSSGPSTPYVDPWSIDSVPPPVLGEIDYERRYRVAPARAPQGPTIPQYTYPEVDTEPQTVQVGRHAASTNTPRVDEEDRGGWTKVSWDKKRGKRVPKV